MSQVGARSRNPAVAGLGWCFSWRLVAACIQFAGGVYLARTLLPAEFGMVAMVVALVTCLLPLRTCSVPSALIHEGGFDEEIFSTSFWFCLLNSTLIGCAVFLAAPLVARLYGVTEVAGICRIVAISYILGGIGLCHKSLLVRALDFRAHGLLETVGQLAYMGCAIWLARRGHGAWSLAWGQVGESVASLALVFCLAPRGVSLRISLCRLRGLLHYGFSMTGGIVAMQWTEGVSSALVGKMSGTASLGFFQKAFGSSTLAIRHLVWSATDVLFPWMAGLGPDSAESREKAAKIIRTVSVLTWPACVGMAAVADLFLVGIYGSRWSGAIGLLRVLCIKAMFFSIQNQIIVMLWALGRGGQVMRINLLSMFLTWLGLWVGLRLDGVTGAAWGFAATGAIQYFILSVCLVRTTRMNARDYLLAVFPSGTMSVVMGCSVLACRHWLLPTDWSIMFQLLVSVGIGMTVYAVLGMVWRPPAVSDLARALQFQMGDDTAKRVPYLAGFLRFLAAREKDI